MAGLATKILLVGAKKLSYVIIVFKTCQFFPKIGKKIAENSDWLLN
jgi:hypothetical protein